MVTLQRKYLKAHTFSKPTVLRLEPGKWAVVGPGFGWLGDEYPTWEAAIRAALNGR